MREDTAGPSCARRAALEGETVDVQLDAPPAEGDWTPLLASPDAVVGAGTVRLSDGEGLVLRAG